MLCKGEAPFSSHHAFFENGEPTDSHLMSYHYFTWQFLGTLVDNCELVRCAARKILKLVKTPKLEFFRLFIDGLLENLKICPQVCCFFAMEFYYGYSENNLHAFKW